MNQVEGMGKLLIVDWGVAIAPPKTEDNVFDRPKDKRKKLLEIRYWLFGEKILLLKPWARSSMTINFLSFVRFNILLRYLGVRPKVCCKINTLVSLLPGLLVKKR